MSIADRFKGCAKAEVKTGRVPNPNLGKAAYLIDSIRMKESSRVDKPGFRVEVNMTTLWGIENGKDASGTEVDCNRTGDRVSHCIFSGDYFHKSFKELCLKVIGKEPHEELDIADFICPASEYPNLSELERLELMWEQKLPGMVCAFDESGSPVQAGVFDGQAVIEIGTTEKAVLQLIDRKKGEVEGNFVYDANGQKLSKTYRNSYINRKISKDEIKEKLSEEEITRFFGSVEAFNAIED